MVSVQAGLMFQPPTMMFSETPLSLRSSLCPTCTTEKVDVYSPIEALRDCEQRTGRYADQTMKRLTWMESTMFAKRGLR